MNTREKIIGELASKGIDRNKARTIVELADHARMEAVEAIMRVSDSAPDDMKVEVLLVSLAFVEMQLDVMKEEVDKVMTLLRAGRL